jgi:hypothetical protein
MELLTGKEEGAASSTISVQVAEVWVVVELKEDPVIVNK